MKRLLVTATAVLAVLVLGTAAAVAASPPYTVRVGNPSTAGNHPVTAASTGSVALAFRGSTRPVVNLNCTGLSLRGSVRSGTAVNPWATVSASTWTGCTFVGAALRVTQNVPWSVRGTSAATSATTDLVAGRIDSIDLTFSIVSNPSLCTFSVVGSASSALAEGTSPQQLRVSETGFTGRLAVAKVTGCLGKIVAGDAVNLETLLNLTSPDGRIDLS